MAEDRKEEAAPPQAFDKAPPVGTKAMRRVSKQHFVVSEKTERSEYEGKHYVFCCSDCKAPFDAEPEKYTVAPRLAEELGVEVASESDEATLPSLRRALPVCEGERHFETRELLRD